MKIYIATSNSHKIKEFGQMFADCGIECQVFGAKELCENFSPIEDGKTFAENALIKARALRTMAPSDSFVMADDSGIVVDALDGKPGIYSARYAGVSGVGADTANNKKLLEELKDIPDSKRTARFICAIAFILPNLSEHIFEGKIEGVINHSEAGCGGFGYDPLFYLPERGMTTAELSAEEKNNISHRGNAFRKMVEFIKTTKGKI